MGKQKNLVWLLCVCVNTARIMIVNGLEEKTFWRFISNIT